MATNPLALTKRPAWRALQTHYQKIKDLHLRQLFASDPQRGERFAIEEVGIYFDHSKHRSTDETIRLLVQLAEACGLRERIDAMFRGEKINVTEDRAVLHVALRAPKGQSIAIDGEDVVPQVHTVLDKMADFATQVRTGTWRGHTGKRSRNVITVGLSTMLAIGPDHFRAMPGLIVMRPADANEVVEAYRVAMQVKDRPVLLILSRQALPTLDRTKYAPASGVAQGAYVLADDADGKPDVLLLATGSEVSLCVDAYERLAAEGIRARVVSMPSWELFEHQNQEYRARVLPPDVIARVAVEEASTFGWERYTGMRGTILGMHTFGLSAPMKVVAQHFGFDPEHVVAAAKAQLARQRSKP